MRASNGVHTLEGVVATSAEGGGVVSPALRRKGCKEAGDVAVVMSGVLVEAKVGFSAVEHCRSCTGELEMPRTLVDGNVVEDSQAEGNQDRILVPEVGNGDKMEEEEAVQGDIHEAEHSWPYQAHHVVAGEAEVRTW